MAINLFEQPWYKAPEVLMETMETFYVEAWKREGKVPEEVATRKLIHYRNWESVPVADVRREVEDLGVVWVPRCIEPGPALVFPIRDFGLTDEDRRLHCRLLEDGPGADRYGCKYLSIVNPDRFLGPAWVGNDDDTVEAMIETGEVLLVEGPLDLLAVRVAGCPIPSLSSLSKRLTWEHWTVLRILGVKKIHVMFDVEESGVGERAAEWLTRNPYDIKVNLLTCPGHDPSACLESSAATWMLRQELQRLRPPTFIDL